MDPSIKIFDESKISICKMLIARATAFAAVFATIGLLIYALAYNKAHAQSIILGLAAAWATLAPIWFFLEFYYFYRKAPGKPGSDSWDLFKHGQQLGTAVWAGVAATLYFFGNSDFVKQPPDVVTCSIVVSKSEQTAEPIGFVKCPK